MKTELLKVVLTHRDIDFEIDSKHFRGCLTLAIADALFRKSGVTLKRYCGDTLVEVLNAISEHIGADYYTSSLDDVTWTRTFTFYKTDETGANKSD